MNTNVKAQISEYFDSKSISNLVVIEEIVRSLAAANRHAKIYKDPEILYFISMALQCANEKMILTIYERK